MRLIEIKKGFGVNAESIEAIEAIDDFTTRIYTPYNIYIAEYNLKTVMSMLNAEETAEERINRKVEAVLKNQQHFAG
jgi:uncharacterized protein YlzI (FlbEa/FlbD family)